MDVNSSPAWKAAAGRHLETLKGTPQYVELIEKLKLRGQEDEWVQLALESPLSTAGAKAATLVVQSGGVSRFEQAARDQDESRAVNALAALGMAGGAAAGEALQLLATDEQLSAARRVAAANALGRSRPGQRFLLSLAESGKLAPDLKFTAANILLASPDEAVRTAAARHLELPATANSQPLPPVAELLKMSGNPDRGRQVFLTQGTCIKCHKVRGEGKDVGPDLSEIGSKLSRDALFVSILDPSAGISHGYESYVVATASGQVLTGLMVSRTEQTITIRSAEDFADAVGPPETDVRSRPRGRRRLSHDPDPVRMNRDWKAWQLQRADGFRADGNRADDNRADDNRAEAVRAM
jgi:putative heme-binding domain-containing protein